MTEKPEDFPFAEVEASCRTAIARGCFIIQKWTCAGCAQRITGGTVNFFCREGHCQHCNTVTDLVARGCNFVLVKPSVPGMTVAEVEQALGLFAGTKH